MPTYYLERSDGKRIPVPTNTGKSVLHLPAEGGPVLLPAIISLDVDLANIAANTVVMSGPAFATTTDNASLFLPEGETSGTPEGNAKFREVLVADENGSFSANIELADVSDVIPPKNVLGIRGGGVSVGDGVALGGRLIGSPHANLTIQTNTTDDVFASIIEGEFTIEGIASLKHVSFGNSVTSIGAMSFYFSSLTSVTIPDSVTSIGGSAFAFTPLTSVTIPDSVTSIGANAFSDASLTSVTFPNNAGFTTIGISVCSGNSLTSVTIPDSVTTIGDYAFNDNELTSVTIPDSVTTIGMHAFDTNALTSVTIGNSVTTIGDYAFIGYQPLAPSNNALTSVTIPDSVTTIGDYAFHSNPITSLTLGNSVETIGSQAFSDNSLTSVTIPDSATTIGDYAFDGSSLLATVNAHVTKTVFDTGSNILNGTAASLTLNVPIGDTTWDALIAASPTSYQGNSNVTVVATL